MSKLESYCPLIKNDKIIIKHIKQKYYKSYHEERNESSKYEKALEMLENLNCEIFDCPECDMIYYSEYYEKRCEECDDKICSNVRKHLTNIVMIV